MDSHSMPETSWIAWNPSQIEKFAKQYIRDLALLKKKILAVKPKDRTLENTLLLWTDNEVYQSFWYPNAIALLAEISTDKKVRDCAHKVSVSFSKQAIEISQDPKLYEVFKSLEIDESTPAQTKKLYIDTIHDMEQSGFALPEKQFKKILAIKKALATQGQQFQKNIRDDNRFLEISDNDAKELPSDYVGALRKTKSGYRIPIDFSMTGAFLRYSTNDNKVIKCTEMLGTIGGVKNLTLLKKTLADRQQLALLLGKANYSELVTQDEMAENPKNVMTMLDTLVKTLKPAYQHDIRALFQYQSKKTKKLPSWQIPRLTRLYQESPGRTDLAAPWLKKYFPLEQVRSSMFSHFSDLLQISFEPISAPVWHSTVSWYRVTDIKSKVMLGFVAIDPHPREGKHKSACAFPLFRNTKNTPATVVLMTDIQLPMNGAEPTLTIREVETLFHEFGHICHYIVSQRGLHSSQNGFTVSNDFVELPSQLFEEWVWHPQILKKLSLHTETKKPLTSKQITDIISARFQLDGSQLMAQTIFAILDQILHTVPNSDPRQTFQKLLKKYRPEILTQKTNLFPASFHHIGDSGYGGLYYSYLWSLAVAKNCIKPFHESGMSNKKWGAKLRTMLAAGSSVPEIELINEYLGGALDFTLVAKEVINEYNL